MPPQDIDGCVELLADEYERVADLLFLRLAQAPELQDILQLLHESKELRDRSVNVRGTGWSVA